MGNTILTIPADTLFEAVIDDERICYQIEHFTMTNMDKCVFYRTATITIFALTCRTIKYI